MSFKLEDLPYQRQAIEAAIRLFEGQQRNYFDFELQGDCSPNRIDLARKAVVANVEKIATENGISKGEANLCIDPDYCIEMETGTGKTLVYLRTIYELSREYGLTKFIILVPSVPIREGVLDTIESFRPQLERLYRIPLHAFEYDSKKLPKVKHFIEGSDLQVMVMTTHSFSADDNIINRPDRDDSPDGFSYWQALAKVRPVIIMDEPQEGMDTDNLAPRLNALNPVARLRYSATHKVLRNLIYRLTPFEAYNQRLVKKIEVLSVAEINDEATLKIELIDIQTGKGAPKAKLKAWRQMAGGYKYAETKWLKAGDSLEEATKNISYRDFKIAQIRAQGLRGGGALVKFHNGVELTPNAATGDVKGIFRQQLFWLCYRHFEKVEKLNEISLQHYEAEIELTRIDELDARKEARATSTGSETVRLAADFSPMDLIEELSENTALAYPTLVKIVHRLSNLDQLVRNPPRYLHLASEHINRIAIDEMVRTINYEPTGQSFGIDLFKDVVETFRATVPTPNTGIYDHAILDADSLPEDRFANEADRHPRVRALLKLPDWYKIPVPSLKGGTTTYTPDFGVVISQKGLRDDEKVELHLVVETKSTDNIDALSAEERIKIQCAIKHFHALGISANTTLLYKAPVSRFTPGEDSAPYGGEAETMGFFAPATNFGATLQKATASAEQKTS